MQTAVSKKVEASSVQKPSIVLQAVAVEHNHSTHADLTLKVSAKNVGKEAVSYDVGNAFMLHIRLAFKSPKGKWVICRPYNQIASSSGLISLLPGKSFDVSIHLTDCTCDANIQKAIAVKVLWESRFFGGEPNDLLESNEFILSAAEKN